MPPLHNGWRGPNVSQLLRELRTIPPPSTAAAAAAEYALSAEDDLSMFTNSEFFDFDLDQNTDCQAVPSESDSGTIATESSSWLENYNATAFGEDDLAQLDFMSGDFDFGLLDEMYGSSILTSVPGSLESLQHVHPTLHDDYASKPHHLQQHANYVSGIPGEGEKHKATEPAVPGRPFNLEEATKQAADEDKRRRNTAASARFRIKKKEREQALERSARETREKVTTLEGRITELETENRWLRNLIMEHNERKGDMTPLGEDFPDKIQSGHTESTPKKETEQGVGKQERTTS